MSEGNLESGGGHILGTLNDEWRGLGTVGLSLRGLHEEGSFAGGPRKVC